MGKYLVKMRVLVAIPSTILGNLIDVAYDSETDAVYISEVGNGKFWVILPLVTVATWPHPNKELMTASSIYFFSDETDVNIGDI